MLDGDEAFVSFVAFCALPDVRGDTPDHQVRFSATRTRGGQRLAVLSDEDEGIAEALRRERDMGAAGDAGMDWEELKKGLER